MNVISRKVALDQGLTHYYTGKPCKHGHDSNRYVNGGACVKCMNARVTAYNDNFRRPTIRTSSAPISNPRVFRFEIQVPLEATPEQRKAFAYWIQHIAAPHYFAALGLRYGPLKSKG